MNQAEYAVLLARAGKARTIAELRALAAEVRAADRDDADAVRVEDVCRMYAIDMLAQLRSGRSRGPRDGAVEDYSERAYR